METVYIVYSVISESMYDLGDHTSFKIIGLSKNIETAKEIAEKYILEIENPKKGIRNVRKDEDYSNIVKVLKEIGFIKNDEKEILYCHCTADGWESCFSYQIKIREELIN